MGGEVLLETGPVRLRRCRHGPMLYLTTDRAVGRSPDVHGEYLEDEVGVFRVALQPGQVAAGRAVNILCLPRERPQSVPHLREVLSPRDPRPV